MNTCGILLIQNSLWAEASKTMVLKIEKSSAKSLGSYIIILVLWQSPGSSCLQASHYDNKIEARQILKQRQ